MKLKKYQKDLLIETGRAWLKEIELDTHTQGALQSRFKGMLDILNLESYNAFRTDAKVDDVLSIYVYYDGNQVLVIN